MASRRPDQPGVADNSTVTHQENERVRDMTGGSVRQLGMSRRCLGTSIAAVCLMPIFGTGHAFAAEPAELVRTWATPGAAVNHAVWNRLLKTYVKISADGINRVDYAAFRNGGQGDLKLYIRSLEKIDPGALDRREQFAFLANLYNAKTIDIVLDHYPVKSIKDISLGGGFFSSFAGGPWKAKVLTVRGVELSLDDVEHGILRPVFKDPRAHYSVNCASLGCPNLQAEAFVGARLDAQLDAAARAFVNHPRGAVVTRDGLVVSSIYSWFKADFGNSDGGVVAHLRKYASPAMTTELQSVTSVAKHQYDWSLNDASR